MVMEYYSFIKKNEITSFATKWRDLDIIILSKLSQTQTLSVFSLACKIKNKKKKDMKIGSRADGRAQ